MDSGFTGSLRSNKSHKSGLGVTETEMKPLTTTPLSARRLEDINSSTHRSSIYIEPSNEEGTQI